MTAFFVGWWLGVASVIGIAVLAVQHNPRARKAWDVLLGRVA